MTSPDNDASWAALEEMLTNAEDFYQALGLAYQACLIFISLPLLLPQRILLVTSGRTSAVPNTPACISR